MPGQDWKGQWAQAKKDFKKATKRKKPKTELENKAKKRTGLAKILKNCDNSYAAFQAATDKQDTDGMARHISDLSGQARQFKRRSDAYAIEIQNEMIKAGDQRILMKELDILRKQLNAISATMMAHLRMFEARFKKLRGVEALAYGLRDGLQGALKRGYLFAAKVRTQKDTKFWNTFCLKASRDIYQQIGNLGICIKKHGGVQGIPAKKPPASLEMMRTWRDGKITFEAADLDGMMKERMKFLKVCQDIDKWLNKAA